MEGFPDVEFLNARGGWRMTDDELIMISALQHYIFCPRQCALIHVEQNWSENYLTASGKVMHEHVDTRGHQKRKDYCTATSIRLTSKKLGLVGIADMLEFHQVSESTDAAGRVVGARLENLPLFWMPYPVEYKHGKPKEHRADEIQLCAQALCLEEMLNVEILKGALFYGKTRRREEIEFDDGLRKETEETAFKVHELVKKGVTPVATYGKWCEACSVFESCRPREFSSRYPAKKWLARRIQEVLGAS